MHYPEKKGYSARSLTYMCQFARTYPLRALQYLIETDAKLIASSVKEMADEVRYLNDARFTQEPLAQIHSAGNKEIIITQEPLAQIQNLNILLRIFSYILNFLQKSPLFQEIPFLSPLINCQ